MQNSSLFGYCDTLADSHVKLPKQHLSKAWAAFHVGWNGNDAALLESAERVTASADSDLTSVVSGDRREKIAGWGSESALIRKHTLGALPELDVDSVLQKSVIALFAAQLHFLNELPKLFFILEPFREIYCWDFFLNVRGLIPGEVCDSAPVIRSAHLVIGCDCVSNRRLHSKRLNDKMTIDRERDRVHKME